jgi:hypothetical protein
MFGWLRRWGAPGSPAAHGVRVDSQSVAAGGNISNSQITIGFDEQSVRRRGNFVYFDTTTHTIRPEHVMTSGALPPGLPAIEIDGEHYWDGRLQHASAMGGRDRAAPTA